MKLKIKKEHHYNVSDNSNPNNNYNKEKEVLLKELFDLKLSNAIISPLSISRLELTKILYYNEVYQNI